MAAQPEIELVDDSKKPTEEEDNIPQLRQQENRMKEWGQQLDKWLINMSRREKPVELLLSLTYPGFTTDGNLLTGIPKRIDKDAIQMVVNGKELWLNRAFIVGYEAQLGTKPSKSSAS